LVFLTRRTLAIASALAIAKNFPQAGNHDRAPEAPRSRRRDVAVMFVMWTFDGHEGSPGKTLIPHRGGKRRACR
jgi:hypothetical protein